MERTITIQQIKDVAQEAYNLYKDNTDGKNADYIPYLANFTRIRDLCVRLCYALS